MLIMWSFNVLSQNGSCSTPRWNQGLKKLMTPSVKAKKRAASYANKRLGVLFGMLGWCFLRCLAVQLFAVIRALEHITHFSLLHGVQWVKHTHTHTYIFSNGPKHHQLDTNITTSQTLPNFRDCRSRSRCQLKNLSGHASEWVEGNFGICLSIR